VHFTAVRICISAPTDADFKGKIVVCSAGMVLCSASAFGGKLDILLCG
jgi:hypothetical protein